MNQERDENAAADKAAWRVMLFLLFLILLFVTFLIWGLYKHYGYITFVQIAWYALMIFGAPIVMFIWRKLKRKH